MTDFMNSLPVEVVEVIARHLSTRPNRSDWATFVSPHDAIAVYERGGLLAVALRTQQPSLCISDWRDMFASVLLFERLGVPTERGALFLHANIEATTVRKVLDASSHFTSITVSGALRQEQALTRLITRSCTNVRNFELRAGISDTAFVALLHARRGHLEALHASVARSAARVKAVAKCIRGVRELALTEVADPLHNVWIRGGSTLVDVQVDLDEVGCYAAAFRVIRRHCINLRTLVVTGHERCAEPLTKTLEHYGVQIRTAVLDGFSVTQCARILQACPKARFELLALDGAPAEHMAVLGPTLTALTVSFNDAADATGLADAVRSCTEIERLDVTDMGFTGSCTLEELLSVRYERLVELRMNISGENLDMALSLLSNACNSLHSASFWVLGVTPHPDALDRFVCANNCLYTLRINTFDGRTPDNVDVAPSDEEATALADIIYAAAKSPALMEIVLLEQSVSRVHNNTNAVLVRHPTIDNACRPLRQRHAHVHVWGVDYVP